MALADFATPYPPTTLPSRTEAALQLARFVRQYPAILRWRADLQRRLLTQDSRDELRAWRLGTPRHGA